MNETDDSSAAQSSSVSAVTPACAECGGATVMFSRSGLQTQYRICTRYQEPGHISKAEVEERVAQVRKALRPSGRFA